MKIAIGSDQHGLAFKKTIIEMFGGEHVFVDVGTYSEAPVSYPIIGKAAAEKVSSGECERAILICGTGIGMAMTANKVKGCYAAVCHDIYSTERSILSNNANIMCMGALVIGKKTMEELVACWLSLCFDENSHSAANVAGIHAVEAEYFKT